MPLWHISSMKLSAYLEREGFTHQTFGERVGASQTAVTRWSRGERIPREKQMAAIVEATGGEVGPGDFYGVAPAPQPQTEAAA